MKTFAILVLFAIGACSGATDKTPLDQKQQSAASTPGLCQDGDTDCVPHCQDGCCPQSPVVIDLGGDGFDLTSAADGVTFEMAPGAPTRTAWTRAGGNDAWLALPAADGKVHSGAQLFGTSTPLGSGGVAADGFKALAQYDELARGGNLDGKITPADGAWKDLRAWLDDNHNGTSESTELLTLDSVGIHALGLDASVSEYTDAHGNEFRLKASIVADKPVGSTVSDVWLQQTAVADAPQESQVCTTTYACAVWTYATTPNVNPNTGKVDACSLPSVHPEIDTDIYTFNGVPHRWVYRFALNSDLATASRDAEQQLFDALHTNQGYCLYGSIPNPDPTPGPLPNTTVRTVVTSPRDDRQPGYSYFWSCNHSVTCVPSTGGCGGLTGGGATPQ